MQHSNLPTHRILIIGPAWVGDMVMAQTLFIILKQQYPSAKIDVLAPPWTRPLLTRMPEVHQALDLPLKHGELNLKKRYTIGKILRTTQYDQAIVLPNAWKSAFIPWIARIPMRTGWAGEMRIGLLNDRRRLNPKLYPLMIERFIALAHPPGTPLTKPYPHPKLVTHQSDQKNALNIFNLNLNKPVLALCPGAEFGPSKRWPAHHYASVAKHYLEKGWQVWLFGSTKDRVVTDEISAHSGPQQVYNLAGKTSLAQAIDLMSAASLVLSNDSGLMHIAASLDKPLVVIYGSSSPGFTPPLSHQVKIMRLGLSCSPCFQRNCPLHHMKCMENLKPEKILKAMSHLESAQTPQLAE